MTLDEEPLNPHQCRSMSSKLESTMRSIQDLLYSVDNFSLVCSSMALENFYRVSEKAKQLVESCCSENWCQASAFQIQNEEAFKEILLETSLSYNTICTLAEDINSSTEFSFHDLRLTSTFEPPSADEILKDQVALRDRFNRLVNVTSGSSSRTRSQHLAWYLLGRLNYILQQSNHEGFDVRTFSLWSDGKGPDGEWSKELEALGGNVFTTTWLDVPCAKKLFKDEMEEDEWLEEAKILASLNHPNIVKFLCCNKYETIHSWGHFIAMEQMETSLYSLIKRLKKVGTKLSIFQAVDIMSQIGYGMCYLHDNGVAHRDLKTSNVVVRSINAPHLQYSLHVKVVDFGLSKAKLKASKSNTISRPKIGTTVYMPPEAFSSGRANWFKADAYSFSVMCSVILSGDEPFQEIKRRDLCDAICSGVRPKLPTNIPEELTSLITEAWAADRGLRPDFFNICTRLEKLRHLLLMDHSLESSKQRKAQASNLYIDQLYIKGMLTNRSSNRKEDHSRVHPQIPMGSNVQEEWSDGDERSSLKRAASGIQGVVVKKNSSEERQNWVDVHYLELRHGSHSEAVILTDELDRVLWANSTFKRLHTERKNSMMQVFISLSNFSSKNVSMCLCLLKLV